MKVCYEKKIEDLIFLGKKVVIFDFNERYLKLTHQLNGISIVLSGHFEYKKTNFSLTTYNINRKSKNIDCFFLFYLLYSIYIHERDITIFISENNYLTKDSYTDPLFLCICKQVSEKNISIFY